MVSVPLWWGVRLICRCKILGLLGVCMAGVYGLAVALLPYALTRDGVLRLEGRRVRVWVKGEYARLLMSLAGDATYREYTTRVRGRMYRRGVVTLRGRTARALARIYGRGRLGRLVRRRWELARRAFLLYTPRAREADYDRLLSTLKRLVGRNTALKLVRELVRKLRRIGYYGAEWIKQVWLNELFRKRMRAYGFMKTVYACSKEKTVYMEVSEWRAWRLCLEEFTY